jgi:hypothetical protein
MDRNLGKSNSRAVETCNAWEPGAESVAEMTYDAWILQEEGRTLTEARILYDARIAPPETTLEDEKSLEAGLDFVYGDCFWVDKRTIKGKILSPRTAPETSRRFYLNQPRSSSKAWIQPQEWSVLACPEFKITTGDEIGLFFDGSRTQDETALIACHIATGFVFTIDIWAPEKIRGTKEVLPIPVNDVDSAVDRTFSDWDVVGFFGDVREWESFTRTEWPNRYADRLKIWAVPGGKEPMPVAWDMRTHVYDFTMAAELTFNEITEDRAFQHDGDSRLARHVANARRAPNRWGVSISKETPDSPKKIDGGVCMIGARMIRRLFLARDLERPDTKKKERSGRVWSF